MEANSTLNVLSVSHYDVAQIDERGRWHKHTHPQGKCNIISFTDATDWDNSLTYYLWYNLDRWIGLNKLTGALQFLLNHCRKKDYNIDGSKLRQGTIYMHIIAQ